MWRYVYHHGMSVPEQSSKKDLVGVINKHFSDSSVVDEGAVLEDFFLRKRRRKNFASCAGCCSCGSGRGGIAWQSSEEAGAENGFSENPKRVRWFGSLEKEFSGPCALTGRDSRSVGRRATSNRSTVTERPGLDDVDMYDRYVRNAGRPTQEGTPGFRFAYEEGMNGGGRCSVAHGVTEELIRMIIR